MDILYLERVDLNDVTLDKIEVKGTKSSLNSVDE